MIFTPLALAGAYLAGTEPKPDERGHFARSFCRDEFRQHGLCGDFPQHSLSFNHMKGTLRGLHFQASPHAETKLVRCARGAIFDVIVDIRAGSPTHGQWYGTELNEDNALSLYIPEGFAHGFITLRDASEVHYLINKPHVPGFGRTIRWDDATLNITWPLAPVLMSDNDRYALAFRDAAAD
jgi:dTDP-4-dehydrorhamnose 3,5-epimerase